MTNSFFYIIKFLDKIEKNDYINFIQFNFKKYILEKRRDDMQEILSLFGQPLALCLASTSVLILMSHIFIIDYKERV